MTKGQFIELVLDPGKASEYPPDEIGALVEQFPYCQPLRFLQLRCFADRQSIQYPAALKITSAYAPDRSRLFHLIHSPMEAGHDYDSTTPDRLESETSEVTANRQEREDVVLVEANSTDHYEGKVEAGHPSMQVISRNEDDFIQEPVITDSPFMPHTDEPFTTSQQREPTTDEAEKTDPQELLIQRLKELNLWPEDEEEAIIQASGFPPTSSIPVHPDIHPLSAEQEVMEEEVKDDYFQSDYEKHDHPTAGSIQPVPTDYFSLPGTADGAAIVLNENKGDGLTKSPRREVREPQPEKLTFSAWLKAIGKETRRDPDEPGQSGIREERTTPGLGRSEKSPSGTAITENSRQNNPKSKLIYSRDAVGNDMRRPLPANSDEITGTITQVPPTKPDRRSGKELLPKPMTVAEDPPNPRLPPEQLIEKFITEEPRITPSKSTFYSPVNMARKSSMETEDLVTETLASILARQGNFQKAIQYYEKLSLKFPEKSRYFAGLIEELNKKLNS